MTMAPQFLSERIPSRERVTAQFVTEVQIHIFAFSLLTICMEVFLLMRGDMPDFEREIFALLFMSFFLFFCILDYILKLFVTGRVTAFFSFLPAVLLLLLGRAEVWPYLTACLITAIGARLFLVFVPGREILLTYGSFVLCAVAVCLYLAEGAFAGNYTTDRFLFICLAVMTLAALQKVLYARHKEAFPFHFFLLMGIIMAVIPMSREPINWDPVVSAGERLAGRLAEAADSVSYYLSLMFDRGSYTAGYSSLDVKGGKVGQSEKTQLILSLNEKPYRLYTDEETLRKMKMRRTVYLAGGRGFDGPGLVNYLSFLYANDVDRAHASLFSEISDIKIEYAYLETKDEIAPASSFLLTAGNARIESGVSDDAHKKGYKINARCIDVDYGSPYFISLLAKSDTANVEKLSYDTACDYMAELYGIHLESLVSREEYEGFAASDMHSSYTDTSGSSRQMADLAHEITGSTDSDYYKCRNIEAYLRQYEYSLDAVGGHDPASDMSTAQGMADIADRFLFESERGYCVHYASSMVMLLRLSGIPARAVSGYRYEFPFDEQESYNVSSNCAHIWPEAYLENVGWVPFEPTRAYRTADDYTWHRRAENESPAAHEETELHVPDLPAAEEQPEEEESKVFAAKILGIAWPVILSVIILLVVLIAGTAAIRRIRYRNGTPAMRLKTDVETIKRNIRRRSGEDFSDRGLLSDYLEKTPWELRPHMREVFAAYYRVVYGDNADVSASENELARELREKTGKKSTWVQSAQNPGTETDDAEDVIKTKT